MLKRILISRRGEGYIDVCVLVLCAMLVIALAVKVLPVYVAKQQLDTFAAELVREAEITGRSQPFSDVNFKVIPVWIKSGKEKPHGVFLFLPVWFPFALSSTQVQHNQRLYL